MSNHKENQLAIAGLGTQAQQLKEQPFYKHLESEVYKESHKLRRELRTIPETLTFEEIGRRSVVINTQLNVWERWNKIVEDAIKNGEKAKGTLRDLET